MKGEEGGLGESCAGNEAFQVKAPHPHGAERRENTRQSHKGSAGANESFQLMGALV